jgi:hypothetical protein
MSRRQRIAGGAVVVSVLTLGAALTGCELEQTADPGAPPAVDEEPAPDAGPSADAGTLPGLPGPADGRAQLAELTIAGERPMTGYSREEFPHWLSVDGCTTRQRVLLRDGTDVVTDDGCQPQSGEWFSPFDNETVTSASDIDIDHIVPLASAWRSGADSWDEETRRAFANDLDRPQLIAVTAGSNRSKGDQSPADWQPVEEYWCVYGLAWTATKHAYELTVTDEEHAVLTEMLDTCEAG